MTVYNLLDQVPLTFQRIVGGAIATGLTVTVVVKNAVTGSTLLSSTSCTEAIAGSGIYTYNWSHGLSQPTTCVATYTVGGKNYSESFLIQDSSGSHSA